MEAGYRNKPYYLKQHQSTETLSFTGNWIITNYPNNPFSSFMICKWFNWFSSENSWQMEQSFFFCPTCFPVYLEEDSNSPPVSDLLCESLLRWTMTRWRGLTRRSLTTLRAPKRPTTSDRCLRSTTRAEPSGSPITGCPVGSTPPTHQPGPCLSTNLIKINEQPIRLSVSDVLGFSDRSTCVILNCTLFNSDKIEVIWN